MAAEHVDTLACFLAGTPRRRGARRHLAGAALGGVVGWLADGAADAHNALQACKKKSGKAKKKCIKKAKKHNATHATPPPPARVNLTTPPATAMAAACKAHAILNRRAVLGGAASVGQ
jgi:hypothetical protein